MRSIFALALSLALSAPQAAHAQAPSGSRTGGAPAANYYEAQKKLGVKNPPGEKIVFDSVTPLTLRALLDGAGEPAKVEGYLQMPAKSAGPAPVVIVFNCGDTIKQFKELAYAGELRKQGYAVFLVNSFLHRGDSGEPAAFFRLRHAAVADALAALKLLAADQRIDSRRIAILGWANGGVAVLGAANEALRARYAGSARFAAMIPIQAWCGVATVGREYSPTPILMLHGGRDDFLPAEHCRTLARDATAAGARIELVIYPEAAHNWDATAPVRFVPEWPTVRNCLMVTDLRTGTLRLGNGQALAADDPAAAQAARAHMQSCRGMGHTAGRVEAVRARALGDVKAFLRKSFDAAG